MPEATLISLWQRLFGFEPVTLRNLITVALEFPDLAATLTALVPDFATDPRPRVFSRWLLARENHPLPGPNNQLYRLSRAGYSSGDIRWRLRLIETAEAAE